MRRYFIQKRWNHDTQWQRAYAINGFYIKGSAVKTAKKLNYQCQQNGDPVEYRVWDDKENCEVTDAPA